MCYPVIRLFVDVCRELSGLEEPSGQLSYLFCGHAGDAPAQRAVVEELPEVEVERGHLLGKGLAAWLQHAQLSDALPLGGLEPVGRERLAHESVELMADDVEALVYVVVVAGEEYRPVAGVAVVVVAAFDTVHQSLVFAQREVEQRVHADAAEQRVEQVDHRLAAVGLYEGGTSHHHVGLVAVVFLADGLPAGGVWRGRIVVSEGDGNGVGLVGQRCVEQADKLLKADIAQTIEYGA